MKSKNFQFEKNLKNASTKTSDYIDEWVQETVLVHFQQDTKENRCICNRKLKKGYYMRNTVNNNMILVGSSCVNKFNGKIETSGNKFNQNTFQRFKKGLYQHIINMHEYTKDVLKDYITHCERSDRNTYKELAELYRHHPCFKDLFQEFYRHLKEEKEKLLEEKRLKKIQDREENEKLLEEKRLEESYLRFKDKAFDSLVMGTLTELPDITLWKEIIKRVKTQNLADLLSKYKKQDTVDMCRALFEEQQKRLKKIQDREEKERACLSSLVAGTLTETTLLKKMRVDVVCSFIKQRREDICRLLRLYKEKNLEIYTYLFALTPDLLK